VVVGRIELLVATQELEVVAGCETVAETKWASGLDEECGVEVCPEHAPNRKPIINSDNSKTAFISCPITVPVLVLAGRYRSYHLS